MLRGHAHATAHVCKSEDNLMKLTLSIHLMVPGIKLRGDMGGNGKRERRKKENKMDLEAAFEGQSALGVGVTEGMCNWRPVIRSLAC